MRAIGLLLIVVCGASCVLLQKKDSGSSSSASSDDDKPSVVTEKSGSKVVKFYNTGHRALAAAKAAIGEDDYATASWEYWSARQAASAGKKLVKKLKKSGDWAEGLKYETEFDEEVLSEEDMLEALDKLAEVADKKWEKHKDKIYEAWNTEYGAVTEGQLEKLEALGKPKKSKPDKKGTCWFFEDDDGNKEMYCWTKKGKLAEHTEEKAPEPEKPKEVSAKGVLAATKFGAGRCDFSDQCATSGWRVDSPEGEHLVSCTFGKCLEAGWTVQHPDGRQSRTTCMFATKCLEHGWDVDLADGRRMSCTCNFNDCGRGYECR